MPLAILWPVFSRLRFLESGAVFHMCVWVCVVCMCVQLVICLAYIHILILYKDILVSILPFLCGIYDHIDKSLKPRGLE